LSSVFAKNNAQLSFDLWLLTPQHPFLTGQGKSCDKPESLIYNEATNKPQEKGGKT
jgi:hypothetical protein